MNLPDECTYMASVHLVLPGCAGIYPYWFGVVACIQTVLAEREMRRIEWHTVSASGFGVATVRGGLCMRVMYELWTARCERLLGRWCSGWPWFYELVRAHCTQVQRAFNEATGVHHVYTCSVATHQCVAWRHAAPDRERSKYASHLTASAIIPGLTPRVGMVLEDGRLHADGTLRAECGGRVWNADTAAALTKAFPGCVVLDVLAELGYASVRGAVRKHKLLGLVRPRADQLFVAGWRDCYRRIVAPNKLGLPVLCAADAVRLSRARKVATLRATGAAELGVLPGRSWLLMIWLVQIPLLVLAAALYRIRYMLAGDPPLETKLEIGFTGGGLKAKKFTWC